MTERYTDPLDQASANTDDLIASAVEAQRRQAAPQQEPDNSGKYAITHCVEEVCGVELRIERLKLGYIRCVDCQRELEGRRRMYNR